MFGTHHPLRREILFIVVTKVLLITLLWWSFFHDRQIEVDAGSTATHLVAPPRQSSPAGEAHAQ